MCGKPPTTTHTGHVEQRMITDRITLTTGTLNHLCPDPVSSLNTYIIMFALGRRRAYLNSLSGTTKTNKTTAFNVCVVWVPLPYLDGTGWQINAEKYRITISNNSGDFFGALENNILSSWTIDGNDKKLAVCCTAGVVRACWQMC